MLGCVRGVATAPARRDALPRNAPLRPTAPSGPKPVGRTDCARTTEPGAPRPRTRRPEQLGAFGSSKPPWPPLHRARHPARVSRRGPAQRSRRRFPDPKVHRPSTLAPSTPRRSPRRGATPCASALAAGAPEGVARTPRGRNLATFDAPPRESMEYAPDRVGPARLCDALPHRSRPTGPPSPRSRVDGVATESPRSGWKSPGLLPVSPQEAPTAAQRRTTEPARVAVRVRSTTEAAFLPLAPRERARGQTGCFHRCSSARRLAKPTHPILRTDRADVAADSTSSPDPRFVAISEPRCQLVPVPPRRSKLQRGGGRHEPKLALTFRTKPRAKPASGARTSSSTVLPPRGC